MRACFSEASVIWFAILYAIVRISSGSRERSDDRVPRGGSSFGLGDCRKSEVLGSAVGFLLWAAWLGSAIRLIRWWGSFLTVSGGVVPSLGSEVRKVILVASISFRDLAGDAALSHGLLHWHISLM